MLVSDQRDCDVANLDCRLPTRCQRCARCVGSVGGATRPQCRVPRLAMALQDAAMGMSASYTMLPSGEQSSWVPVCCLMGLGHLYACLPTYTMSCALLRKTRHKAPEVCAETHCTARHQVEKLKDENNSLMEELVAKKMALAELSETHARLKRDLHRRAERDKVRNIGETRTQSGYGDAGLRMEIEMPVAVVEPPATPSMPLSCALCLTCVARPGARGTACRKMLLALRARGTMCTEGAL